MGIGISDPYASQSRGGLCEDVKRRDIGEYTESAGIYERTRNIEKKRGEIKHDRKYEEKDVKIIR